ncbi:MAG: hypothetical protein KGJ77_07105, partial [Acidobacteriota bacterium]|nr:hypothetical protein [Acidobacteriota bacterium]
VGVAVPFGPWAHDLGFRSLSAPYFGALAAMVVMYLALVEVAKVEFFRHLRPAVARPRDRMRRRVHRRAARFSRGGPVPR